MDDTHEIPPHVADHVAELEEYVVALERDLNEARELAVWLAIQATGLGMRLHVANVLKRWRQAGWTPRDGWPMSLGDRAKPG